MLLTAPPWHLWVMPIGRKSNLWARDDKVVALCKKWGDLIETKCRAKREEREIKARTGAKVPDTWLQEVKFRGLGLETGWRHERAQRRIHLRRQDEKERGGEEMCNASAKTRICLGGG